MPMRQSNMCHSSIGSKCSEMVSVQSPLYASYSGEVVELGRGDMSRRKVRRAGPCALRRADYLNVKLVLADHGTVDEDMMMME